MGLLSRSDFELAQARNPVFSDWRDHDEFLQEREGAWYGFATAGVCAELQTVSFAAFDLWGRLTGAPNNLNSFDEFAGHWRRRIRSPGSYISGVLCNADRRTGFDHAVYVSPELFFSWRRSLKSLRMLPSMRATIDDYAALIVECCIDAPRAQAER